MTDPTPELHEPAPEKLHVVTPEPPEPAAPGAALKAAIAGKVREDSRAGRLTTEGAIRALSPELTKGRLGELLGEMAQENAYGDVKAIVAPSGRVYLFSEASLIAVEAQEKARREEAKLAIVERIRTDSRAIALTPAADLEVLFPTGDPAARKALMDELRADPRFQDIQEVAGPDGALLYHSDAHVSGNYAKVMVRARSKDASWAIAEFVRDRSMIQPAPTKLTVFQDPVFGVDPAALEATLVEMAARAEYADVKRLVQRETGAVYLYSERFLNERQARQLMDWEEVERDRNP